MSDSLTNKVPELVSKLVLSIPVKLDLSRRISTKMGKTEGKFLNLQCDCIFYDKSLYQYQHFAAKFDSAMHKWILPQ